VIALVASLWHGVFWPVLFFALAEGACLAMAPRRSCDRAAAQEANRQRRLELERIAPRLSPAAKSRLDGSLRQTTRIPDSMKTLSAGDSLGRLLEARLDALGDAALRILMAVDSNRADDRHLRALQVDVQELEAEIAGLAEGAAKNAKRQRRELAQKRLGGFSGLRDQPEAAIAQFETIEGLLGDLLAQGLSGRDGAAFAERMDALSAQVQAAGESAAALDRAAGSEDGSGTSGPRDEARLLASGHSRKEGRNVKNRLFIALLLAIAVGAALIGIRLRRGTLPAPGPRDPLLHLPASCDAVALAPEVGRAGERLATLPRLKLAQLGATFAGLGSADQLLAELARQAGVDFRSSESLRQAGIDPKGPLAVYLPLGGPPIAALAPADRQKLQALVGKLAGDRAGATRRAEVPAGAGAIVAFATEGSASAAIAYAEVQQLLFVSAGQGCVEALRKVLATTPESSLARELHLARLRPDLERGDAYAFACPASPRAQRIDLPYGAGLGLAIGAAQIRLWAEVELAEGHAKALAALSGPAGADLVGRLDPAAFLVARIGGDPRALQPFAEVLVPPALQAIARQADLDIASELLGNLKPGAAASLSVSPRASLASAPEIDPRRANPFGLVHLTAIGQVADEARAWVAVEKIAAAAPSFGAQLDPKDIGGARAVVASYHLGEGASLSVHEGLALVTGGPGQMEALLGRLSGAPGLELKDSGARKAFAEDGFALYLDIGRLVASLRALPDSAYGIGGFAIKAALSRTLESLDELSGLRLSGRVSGSRLHAELALGIPGGLGEKGATSR
jgi:hypothetical protein